MASTTASRPPALMPVSIRMGENTVDMSVPTNVALAEFAPNIVSQITQLSASSASQGYRITNSQGKVLDQSQTLINQGIQAGSVLILSKIGDSTQDLRYDDLVEAVGTAVENDQAPWNSDNSVDLSTHASALLVLTAAVLIFTGGRGSTMGLIVGLSGAVLASLACAVIARNSSRLAPLSLAHSIPILAGAAVMSAIPGSWSGLPLAGFGIAAMLSASVLLVDDLVGIDGFLDSCHAHRNSGHGNWPIDWLRTPFHATSSKCGLYLINSAYFDRTLVCHGQNSCARDRNPRNHRSLRGRPQGSRGLYSDRFPQNWCFTGKPDLHPTPPRHTLFLAPPDLCGRCALALNALTALTHRSSYRCTAGNHPDSQRRNRKRSLDASGTDSGRLTSLCRNRLGPGTDRY